MPRLFDDIGSITGIVSGELSGTTRRSVRDVQVDSRSCGCDSLFVALSGCRTDGHLFLEDAFRRGSSLSFVSRDYFSKHEAQILELCRRFDASAMVVADTLDALQKLARSHLEAFPDLVSIAVTGSNGKTTTKDLIGAIISKHAPTVVSPGNLNSDIGLPLSSFRVTPEHRFAVFEMGMNRKGEIAELVSIVRPRIAAVTNIGAAHVGLIGSLEAIAREKREVFAHVCDEGRGFVPEDEPFRSILVEGRESCVGAFGMKSTPGYEGVEFLGVHGMRLRLHGTEFVVGLPGAHNLMNVLCAVSVAEWCGVGERDVREALTEIRPGFGRGQVLVGRVTILFDCYNANRHSVLRALELFDSISSTGRRILVLGSMKELGDHSDPEHRMVGRAAAASTADEILFVGDEAAVAYEESASVGGGTRSAHYATVESLAESIFDKVHDGDLVLIKGSRSLELERLVPAIDPDLRVKE